MRRIPQFSLWLGHAAQGRDLRALHTAGIRAVIDLAAEETPAALSRDLTYLRFPLLDGADNPTWLLRLAIESTAHLLQSQIPTLVCCSAGMSRTPCIAAAAVSLVKPCPSREALALVARTTITNISSALWNDVQVLLSKIDHWHRMTE